ncbi:hypothetical protein [Streptomyces sp. NBC_01794]|uniref:DUF6197 family protein n=1 Tax=Streptomyces sp. NBC_01794 TaxID=2975942 RepID=UPI00308C66CD|nr:hypothetical protein OIE54_12275 [Streptomyces sp. NBC_01794]
MVALSVTRSRVATVLAAAADSFGTKRWHPLSNTIILAIDRAAGYTPGCSSIDAEDTSLAAWNALAVHLNNVRPEDWERAVGRTQDDVVDALRGAAKAVTQ